MHETRLNGNYVGRSCSRGTWRTWRCVSNYSNYLYSQKSKLEYTLLAIAAACGPHSALVSPREKEMKASAWRMPLAPAPRARAMIAACAGRSFLDPEKRAPQDIRWAAGREGDGESPTKCAGSRDLTIAMRPRKMVDVSSYAHEVPGHSPHLRRHGMVGWVHEHNIGAFLASPRVSQSSLYRFPDPRFRRDVVGDELPWLGDGSR